jgi:hypothetical protein
MVFLSTAHILPNAKGHTTHAASALTGHDASPVGPSDGAAILPHPQLPTTELPSTRPVAEQDNPSGHATIPSQQQGTATVSQAKPSGQVSHTQSAEITSSSGELFVLGISNSCPESVAATCRISRVLQHGNLQDQTAFSSIQHC